AADLQSGAVTVSAAGLPPIAGETDFDGWRRIDLRERLTAAPGRERAKLPTREAQLEAAADTCLELPPLETGAASGIGPAAPTTILFGTESGGAELVADELARAFGEGADLVVRDLAEVRA